jgi:hypothetical protein
MDQGTPEAGALQFMPFEGSVGCRKKRGRSTTNANNSEGCISSPWQQQLPAAYGSLLPNTAIAKTIRTIPSVIPVAALGSGPIIQHWRRSFSSLVPWCGAINREGVFPTVENRKQRCKVPSSNTAQIASSNDSNRELPTEVMVVRIPVLPLPPIPPSPAHSGASSAYVELARTQDKLGATVAMPNSYDEGSLGRNITYDNTATAGDTASRLRWQPVPTGIMICRANKVAANGREVNRWTGGLVE